MNTKAIKTTLAAHYPTEDYRIIVKLVEEHEVKTRVYPYRSTVHAFIAVGVETKKANSENWKGQARKRHPDDSEVLAILRNAGYAAVLHQRSNTAQMIGIPL